MPFQASSYRDGRGKVVAEVTGLHLSAQSSEPWNSAESEKNWETNAANSEFEQDKLTNLFRVAQYSTTAMFMLLEVGRVSFNSLDVMTPWIITVN